MCVGYSEPLSVCSGEPFVSSKVRRFRPCAANENRTNKFDIIGTCNYKTIGKDYQRRGNTSQNIFEQKSNLS